MAFESVLSFLGSNAMSEYHAQQSAKREAGMMAMQNRMNNQNIVNAPMEQVQGLRLAGLSPSAASNPVSPAQASKGSADMATATPWNMQDEMLQAQIENIKADTDNKKAKTPNVQADTDLKLVQKLLAGANKEKVDEETKNIRNINAAYAEENKALAAHGAVMAQRWQDMDWYRALAPDTKQTIDSIADGDVPLSVGAIASLKKVIDLQRDLSDADRRLVENAFNNVITERMWSDEAVLNAIASEPKIKMDLLEKQRDKIVEELPKIRAEVANLMDDLKTKKLSREQVRAEIDSFKTNNLGYLKHKGEYGKWLEAYCENLLERILPMVTAGSAAGAARSLTEKKPEPPKPSVIVTPDSKGFGETLRNINQGVGSFKF